MQTYNSSNSRYDQEDNADQMQGGKKGKVNLRCEAATQMICDELNSHTSSTLREERQDQTKPKSTLSYASEAHSA